MSHKAQGWMFATCVAGIVIFALLGQCAANFGNIWLTLTCFLLVGVSSFFAGEFQYRRHAMRMATPSRR